MIFFVPFFCIFALSLEQDKFGVSHGDHFSFFFALCVLGGDYFWGCPVTGGNELDACPFASAYGGGGVFFG